jgi:HSP20 family molecular chaperone IbpA
LYLKNQQKKPNYFRPEEIEVHHQGENLIITASQKHNGKHESYERSLKRVIRLPPDVGYLGC